MPETEHEVIYSLALSDRYVDMPMLDDIGRSIKNGQQVRLPKEQEDMLRPAAREYLAMHAPMIARANKQAGSQSDQGGQTFDGRKSEVAGDVDGKRAGSAPSEEQDQNVPFHPNLPEITKVQPAREFEGGEHLASEHLPMYLSAATTKEYIEFAKKRGFATRDELRLYLPMNVTAEEMEEAASMLTEMGITVSGNSEAPQEGAGPITQLRDLVRRLRHH